ncbi:alpha/beta fold hydrolase [Marinobacter fonticola]|uniref:alpha/beta fold hydrolase n=1 Tax=Marinobacter fonticola TaxID=2603215 RepID=UPI0011E74DA2|nr:alpha/beta fold hydrolase [Marinobacter fonticola]
MSRRRKSSLAGKLFSAAAHAVERRLFSENFNVSNRTPFATIYVDGIMSVRHYHPLDMDEILIGNEPMSVAPERYRVPVVLVPPLAATSMIFDLLPQRSVVRYLLARGFDVYLIDWGEVTADHSNLSLETYVLDWMPAALNRVRQHSGVPDVSIFAYCMGGLLALMYAAASQDRHIRNMVTVASPVDMHQMGIAGGVLSAIYRPAQIVSSVLNISLLDLPARYFHIPGWMNSLAFKLTNPVGSLVNSLELLVNLWDREYVKVHSTMQKWFDDMVDYPGETIKGMVVHMALNNGMARGRLRLGGEKTSFDRVGCSILAFAGDSDRIVSIPSAHKVLEIVTSEDKEFCVVPGGHAGVFAGANAPENTWRISADWLSSRSD